MNKLELPTWFDDHQSLEDLSNNTSLRSYPVIQPYVGNLRAEYDQYVANQGNATAIATHAFPALIENFLRGHYSSPPGNLSYIKKLREEGGIKTCPMCGSMSCGTLDHILPKKTFACFAIFGLNLVPACNCNTLRGTALTGPNPGERILHPYFDEILAERLLVARFEDLGAVPSISIRFLLDAAHPSYAAASFHFEKVVVRTQINKWLRKRWNAFVLKPGNVIRDLRRNPGSRVELVDWLEAELAILDEFHSGRNNWESVFLSGLLYDTPVTDWIFDKVNQPGRLPNAPLVEI